MLLPWLCCAGLDYQPMFAGRVVPERFKTE